VLTLLCLLWLISPAESATSTGQAGIALPKGDGAWTVHVMASGGFSSDVSLDLEVASDGTIHCAMPQTPCPERHDVTALNSLIETLPPRNVLMTQPVPPEVFCNDCFTRTIFVRRRESNGTVRSYSARWTDVRKDGVLSQLLQIYDSVIALQKVIAR
jgi:hypothetical protein